MFKKIENNNSEKEDYNYFNNVGVMKAIKDKHIKI